MFVSEYMNGTCGNVKLVRERVDFMRENAMFVSD